MGGPSLLGRAWVLRCSVVCCAPPLACSLGAFVSCCCRCSAWFCLFLSADHEHLLAGILLASSALRCWSPGTLDWRQGDWRASWRPLLPMNGGLTRGNSHVALVPCWYFVHDELAGYRFVWLNWPGYSAAHWRSAFMARCAACMIRARADCFCRCASGTSGKNLVGSNHFQKPQVKILATTKICTDRPLGGTK